MDQGQRVVLEMSAYVPSEVMDVVRAAERAAVERARVRWEENLGRVLADVRDAARGSVGSEVEDARREAYEDGFDRATAIGLAAVARVREVVGTRQQIRTAEEMAKIRHACAQAETLWNAVVR